MGVPLNIAVVLREWLRNAGGGDNVLTLGVQSMAFDRASFTSATNDDGFAGTAQSFFAACGYRQTRALDVSDVEGAEIIFDLNADDTPAELTGQFDVVFNGGTIEHVFHVPNALSHITRMLRPNGVVVHLNPCHNWVDHGFYQFGPTLFFDYYEAARFEPLESALFLFEANQPGPWRVMPAGPEAFGAGLSGTFDGRTALQLFMARKTAESRDAAVPTQSLYRTDRRERRAQSRWFAPFSLDEGRVIEPARYVERALGPFQQDQGLCWVCDAAEWEAIADSSAEPLRSPVVLFEDGVPLGPAHSGHDRIRTEGGGRYSHWGRAVYLSTSDGSNPNENRKTYAALATPDVERKGRFSW
jgi:SAM-dependent methyltransferase